MGSEAAAINTKWNIPYGEVDRETATTTESEKLIPNLTVFPLSWSFFSSLIIVNKFY